jgi:hypothetical protein
MGFKIEIRFQCFYCIKVSTLLELCHEISVFQKNVKKKIGKKGEKTLKMKKRRKMTKKRVFLMGIRSNAYSHKG